VREKNPPDGGSNNNVKGGEAESDYSWYSTVAKTVRAPSTSPL
jgi:hypothetical protein